MQDSIAEIAYGISAGSLDDPEVPFLKAFDDAQATIDVRRALLRLTVPASHPRSLSRSAPLQDPWLAILSMVQASRVAPSLPGAPSARLLPGCHRFPAPSRKAEWCCTPHWYEQHQQWLRGRFRVHSSYSLSLAGHDILSRCMALTNPDGVTPTFDDRGLQDVIREGSRNRHAQGDTDTRLPITAPINAVQ